VSGEEDIDLLAILPPLAVFAFFYLFVAPVRELIRCWLICSGREFIWTVPE
jgi:hypothetical protein